MKKILLCGESGSGKFILVDDEDYEWLNQFKWYLRVGYASRHIYKRNGQRTTIRMHREIMKTPKDMITDHIDRNKLNNQKSNLRICTNSQNMMNSVSPYTAKSGYKGVTVSSKNGKIRAFIYINYKQFFLGYFPDKISAAKAYDIAAKKMFGEFARLNFGE